jgi:hypothetical protein
MSDHPQTPTRHVRFQLRDKENAPRTPATATTGSKTLHSTPQPQSGSKLLRQHFTQMALTPQTRRRLLDSGAVRVAKKRTPSRKAHASPERRIGYDGTPYTPSKELLRSTAASRNQQFHGGVSEMAFTAAVEEEEHVTRGDFDPVASTLLDISCDHHQDAQEHAAPKDVTGDLQDFSGVVRPVAFKLPRYRD